MTEQATLVGSPAPDHRQPGRLEAAHARLDSTTEPPSEGSGELSEAIAGTRPVGHSTTPRGAIHDRSSESPLHGIVLGLYSRDPRHSYRSALAEIRATGAKWVSLCVQFYQPRVDSTGVGVPDPRTPPWERLRHTIREAHLEGLLVLVFPILLIQEPGPDDWRGTLIPNDPEAWFASYTELLIRLARLAREERAAMLSVGSEFNSLQTDTQRWRALLSAVRAEFDGALTYSVNWDSLHTVGFLAQLDLIGLTTYFSLSDENDPSVETLVARLEEIRDDLREWQSFHGSQMYFSEVGYPSLDGANRDPWNYTVEAAVDLAEQRDCYLAFQRVFQHEPALRGLFFYNWYEAGGPACRGYTPRGKPAEAIVRDWFRSEDS